MKENNVQDVARHMGHKLAVDGKFYRLQDDVIELAIISKLLLAVENGHAHHFKEMSIDDLNLKGTEVGITMLKFKFSVYSNDIILKMIVNRYIVTLVISTNYTDQTIKMLPKHII